MNDLAPLFEAQTFDPKRPRISPTTVDTPDIVAWIEDKRPRAIGSWQQLGAEEYARAFTAAGTEGYSVINDLYDGLLETMRQGGGESDFTERMIPVLRDKGWLPQLDDNELGRRVRLIYDTNIRTSQAVGKWRAAQRTKQLTPYIRYSATMDRRTRPGHAVLHGIIRPVDDPIWLRAYPPCGFRCRCVASTLSRSQAARWGGVTDEGKAQDALAQAEATGDLWGYNVGIMADAVAAQQVRKVNEESIDGAPPLQGTFARGASAWSGVFAKAIAPLLEKLFSPGDK